MQLMGRLIREHTDISGDDEVWLMSLVNEWQLLADLSFSDLVLWAPDRDPNIFWALAHVRPTTGPTALDEDVAGESLAYVLEHGVPEAYLTGRMVETSQNRLQSGAPVDVNTVPIVREGRVLAVIERHTNQMGMRAPGSLEDNYLHIARLLAEMVSRGEFPVPGKASDPVMSPRVGDGLIRLDENLMVRYATPNAVTAFRRMGLAGDLDDEHLPTIINSLSMPTVWHTGPGPLAEAFASQEASETQFSVGMISVRLRLLPLRVHEGPGGLLVLIRDVTELSQRERLLVTKDATIREIHHRVKNNLQTVAALLRMQARRMSSKEAKDALNEAMSRVAAIAVVHETLSQTFDEMVMFDDVCDRVLQMVGAVSTADRGDKLVARREGTFGMIPAEAATSLSLVVTELCQNAIEHGLESSGAGEVRVVPRATEDALRVEVIDNGVGLPEGFELGRTRSLGLSIVSTLVSDLGGTFTLESNPTGPGAQATIEVPMRLVERSDEA